MGGNIFPPTSPVFDKERKKLDTAGDGRRGSRQTVGVMHVLAVVLDSSL